MRKVNLCEMMDSFRMDLESITTPESMHHFFASPEQLMDKTSVNQLRKRKAKLFANALLVKAEEYLEQVAIPHVQSYMAKGISFDLNETERALNSLRNEVDMIYQFFQQILLTPRSTKMTTDCPDSNSLSLHIRRTIAVLLSTSKSPSLEESLCSYYKGKLNELLNAMDETESSQLQKSSASHYKNRSSMQGYGITQALKFLLLHNHNEEALNMVVFENFSNHLSQLTESSFESDNWSRVVPIAEHYLNKVIINFLEMYGDYNTLQKWKSRLLIYLYQFIGERRISQLFDISVDYPASTPAIEDIKDCLQANESSLHSIFIEEFSKQINRRLLQAGASTMNIIDHFLTTTKMLSEMDPRGQLMKGMTESYKEYLHDRPDTMKCIVLVLTDAKREENYALEDFSDEMQISDGQDEDPDNVCFEEIQGYLKGNIDLDLQDKRSAVGDLISALVGIYNTKECFLEEYQKMLAEQLMLKSDYCCEREYRVLELLKKRFGESPLHKCEVMLHDIMESKRLNKNLQEETQYALAMESMQNINTEPIIDLSACMLSHMFWPEVNEPQINLPSNVDRALEVYGAKFHSRRAPRKLEWKTGAGVVELEVKIGDQKREYKVSPIHASILLLFSSTDTLTEHEIAVKLDISISVLKAKISFWIKNGILCESHKQGTVTYGRRTQMERPETAVHDDTDDDLQEHQQSEDASFRELHFFKPYILGYLQGRSQGASLDQIHRHLVRFIVQPAFDMNENLLSRCLSRLIEKGKIKLENGTYSLS